MEIKDNKTRIISGIILLSLCVIAFAYLGTFSRYMADDYCVSSAALNSSLAQYANDMYFSWTGRFSYILFSFVLSKLGSATFRIIPALSLIVWVLTPIFCIQVFRKKHVPSQTYLPAILIMLLLIVATFSMTPSIFQTLYWRDGIINYTFPLIGLTNIALTLMLFRKTDDKSTNMFGYIWFFIISFLNSGFAEAYTTTQLSFFFLLTFLLILRNRKEILPLVIIGLIATSAGILLEALAPGNQIRANSIGHDAMSLFPLIQFTLRNTVHAVGRHILFNPLWVVLLAGSGFSLGLIISLKPTNCIEFSKKMANRVFLKLLTDLIMTVAMIAACCFPVAYMLNAFPDSRILLIPAFLVNSFIFSATFHVGHVFSYYKDWSKATTLRHFFQSFLLFIFIVVLLITSIQFNKLLPIYKDYATRWDNREQIIITAKNSGAREVTVYGLESRDFISDIGIEATYWVNSCMADFYNVDKVYGK